MADLTRVDVPSIATIRERYCQDMRRLKQRAGVASPNVAPGSETFIKGEAIAAVSQGIMAREAALQDATMADKAVGDDLVRLAGMRGITPSAGAGASGNAIVSTTGVVVYAAGLECKTDDGLRYQVVTTTAVGDGGSVPIIGIDVGTRTNRVEGTRLTWSSPPAGSDTTAEVGPGGLTNGADADNDARLRRRLLDSLRHPAQSGSWSHYAQWAEQHAAVEKAFVFPAQRGPSTVDICITVAASKDNVWTRTATPALVNAVAGLVVASDPEHADVLTMAADEVETDVVLRIQAPLPAGDGGKGGGWIDSAPTPHWPRYYATAPYATFLAAAPTTPTTIKVDVLDAANVPLVGASIAIWSRSAKRFEHSRIKTVTLSAGTVYDLVLFDAIDSSVLQVDDFVSPDAEKLDDYALTLLQQFATLGPGEITGDALRLPRAYRHPLMQEDWPSQFTSANVGQLSTTHPEIRHVATVTPSLPATPAAASPPKILKLNKLAFYKY